MLCSVEVGGEGGHREGTPGFPSPLLPSPRCPHHANIRHMRGVMPRSDMLPLMIPSMPGEVPHVILELYLMFTTHR